MTLIFSAPVFAAEKPNILAIFGGDIGWFDPSSYNHGMMGYQTPNIDRIAEGDIMFTDAFSQQSCTVWRAVLNIERGKNEKRAPILTVPTI